MVVGRYDLRSKMNTRILIALIRFDVWLMRTFLGGMDGETLSAAAWNAHLTEKFFSFTYHFIDLLFYIWERNHCRKDWQRRAYIYV